jgi:hypothetical protein
MTDRDAPDTGPKPRRDKAQGQVARTARLAERLRANLGRRKQQARGRKTEAEAAGKVDPQDPDPQS